MVKKNNSKKGKTLTSFEELRAEFGLPPIRFQTKDKEKLEGQRARFSSRHLCPVCKQPLVFVENTNIMVCKNDECKGFTREIIDEETGEKEVISHVPFHTLDEKGATIANNIFKNLD